MLWKKRMKKKNRLDPRKSYFIRMKKSLLKRQTSQYDFLQKKISMSVHSIGHARKSKNNHRSKYQL